VRLGNKARARVRTGKREVGPETFQHSAALCSGTTYIAAVQAACAASERREQIKAQHGTPRQLVKNGAWNVPESDRPQNWRALNIPEPEALHAG
jgi:hypothetical protein